MPDEPVNPAPVTPVTPAPAPAPAPKPASPINWLLVIGVFVVVSAATFLGVGLFHDYIRPANPVSTDAVAKVSGMFLAVQPSPSQAVPGNPASPLGVFRVDATGTKPLIMWKTKGPALTPIVFGPGGSIAEAVVTEPGTYQFHAIAVGKKNGLPDVDVDTFQYTVAAPAPPAPPAPTPPTPTPKPVFPSN